MITVLSDNLWRVPIDQMSFHPRHGVYSGTWLVWLCTISHHDRLQSPFVHDGATPQAGYLTIRRGAQ